MNQESGQTRGHTILLVVCAAVFVAVLNGTMVGVALPTIGDEFSLSSVALGWLVTGYFLAYASAIPLVGRLTSIYQMRNLFATGLIIFSLGSLFCALAPGYVTLLVARLLQAMGAATVQGLTPGVVSVVSSRSARGSAMGWIGAAVGIGAAIGPVVGGIVTGAIGWRYPFVFVALLSFALLLFVKSLPEEHQGNAQGSDWVGVLLLGGAVASALLALTSLAQKPDTAASPLLWITIAGLAVAVLWLRQRLSALSIFPPGLLRNRSYMLLASMGLLVLGMNITIEVALPLLLSRANGLPTQYLGLALLPQAIAVIAVAPLGGRLIDRSGVSCPTVAGALIAAVALLLLSTLGVGGPVWAVSLLGAAVASGAVLAKIATTVGVSLVVRDGDRTFALALNETSLILGASIGTALFYLTLDARGTGPATNPLYSGPSLGWANAFSDAFLFLAAPLLAILILSMVLSLTENRVRGPQSAGASKKQSL